MKERNDLTVSRAYHSDCTIGRILSPHFKFYAASLELRWQGNANDASCIPEGRYPYRKAWSNAAQRIVIWIDAVPGRTLIQMHPANYTHNLLGCVAPGASVTDVDGDGRPDVTSSGPMLDKIMDAIPDTGYINFTQASKPLGVYKND